MRILLRAVCQASVLALLSAPALSAPADSYLLRVEKALYLCRRDLPMMEEAAEAAAERLAQGGRLLAGGDAAMVSELRKRAGGLMLIRPLTSTKPQPRDVVLFTPERDGGPPQEVLDSGALVVVLGSKGAEGLSQAAGLAARLSPATEGTVPVFVPKAGTVPGVFRFESHAQEAGISPTLANVIPGWLFTGELIAALTRRGRMPVLFESIGLYGGVPRIQEYEQRNVFWHADYSVPPLPRGVMGNAYVQAVAAMLRRVEREERKDLLRAGEWAAQAKRAGKQLRMYSMGHIFPAEVERTAIGELFKSGEWYSAFSYIKPPDDAYHPGDVLVHIGYQHPPTVMLQRARRSGARVIYVDILQDRDYATDQGVIWIDPMWPWADACVPIEGYDVPALPASAIVNGAIAWELWRVTGKQALGE